MGQYVGLMCMLLEEPGNALDVMEPADLADLADELGCESSDECSALLADMAAAGMIDAASLGSGIVRAPVVDEAVRDRAEFSDRMRAAGRKGAESRWGKRAEDG